MPTQSFLNLLQNIPAFSREDFFFYKFIYFYLFLAAALGLHCARAFSSCGEWRLPFIVVRGLLIALSSLVAEHGL